MRRRRASVRTLVIALGVGGQLTGLAGFAPLVRPARADNPALGATTASAGTALVIAPMAVGAEPIEGGALVFSPRVLVQSDAVVVRHGPDAPAIEDGVTQPGVYLRRARVGADAAAGRWRARLIVEAAARPETVAPAVALATSPETTRSDLDAIAGELSGGGGSGSGGAGGGGPRATEAFVAWTPHKVLAIAAGALRVPIGLSRQVGDADLRLPERARIVTRATPDFRVGVAAGGDLGLFQYALGTYAAAPHFGADFSGGGALYVARLSAEPVGPLGIAPHLRRHDDPWSKWWRFSVGLSSFFAQLPGSNEVGLGGDGQFQWRRLCATGEVLWTQRGGADRVGFTIEPGVFIVNDRLEAVARLEWLNDEIGPRSTADAWGGALGLTFFSATRHARLQAAYTLRRAAVATSGGGDRTPGWAVLRATFVL